MIHYVIPAREGSKGAPGKNRVLFDYTAKTLSAVNPLSVIVTTDDSEIKEKAKGYGFTVHNRPSELCNDHASMKAVLQKVSHDFSFHDEDIIVLLYLTYPDRTYQDIRDAIDFFNEHDADSMLCRKEVKTHPYLCIKKNGTQVIEHDLYRRQDYPVVYELSHFVCILKAEELPRLRQNLYNDNTTWLDIADKTDVDYIDQLERYR